MKSATVTRIRSENTSRHLQPRSGLSGLDITVVDNPSLQADPVVQMTYPDVADVGYSTIKHSDSGIVDDWGTGGPYASCDEIHETHAKENMPVKTSGHEPPPSRNSYAELPSYDYSGIRHLDEVPSVEPDVIPSSRNTYAEIPHSTANSYAGPSDNASDHSSELQADEEYFVEEEPPYACSGVHTLPLSIKQSPNTHPTVSSERSKPSVPPKPPHISVTSKGNPGTHSVEDKEKITDIYAIPIKKKDRKPHE